MDGDDMQVEETPGFEEFMSGGFGKQHREFDPTVQIERARRPVPVKPKVDKPKEVRAQDTDESSDSDDDSDESDDDEFPVSHELVIKTHDKAVTSATLDTSGTRLVTGSLDGTMKLHDIASMTPTTIRAFKSVEPSWTKTTVGTETFAVHQVIFNHISPSQMMTVTALPQVKIYDRNGEVLATSPKGDMYLRDMHNTKGHISEVTSGAWHPTDTQSCVTAGTDSTLRIWDVNNMRSQKTVIVYKSKSLGSGGRSKMTAVAWGAQGQGGPNALIGASLDGTLSFWSGDGPFNRPSGEVKDAHEPQTTTSGLDVSPDGRTVISRGGDNTIKLWDLRSFKKPISTATHPSSSDHYPTSSIKFSASGNNILLGSPTGDLHILNRTTLKPDLVTPVTPGSAVISAQWHPRLNQIITTSANAETRLLWDPVKSHGGASTVLHAAPKARHVDDLDATVSMTLSGTDSLDSLRKPGRGSGHAGSKAGSAADPRRPHAPAPTPFGDRQPDERHVRERVPFSHMREQDPREALLKFAGNKSVYTKAYEKNQPKPVFADLSDEEEEQPDAKKQKR